MDTTTEADTTPTTTETPTTTAEPLPYDINYLMVPSVSRHLEIERACTLQVICCSECCVPAPPTTPGGGFVSHHRANLRQGTQSDYGTIHDIVLILVLMSKEYVFLKFCELRADCRVEQNNVSELPEEVESVLIGFNEKLHVAQWDLASSMT